MGKKNKTRIAFEDAVNLLASMVANCTTHADIKEAMLDSNLMEQDVQRGWIDEGNFKPFLEEVRRFHYDGLKAEPRIQNDPEKHKELCVSAVDQALKLLHQVHRAGPMVKVAESHKPVRKLG